MIGEYNITNEELQSIEGTGEGGRVSKKDIENFLKTRGEKKPVARPELPPWEQPGSGDLFKPTDETIGKVTPRPKPAPAPTPTSPPAPATSTAPRVVQDANEEIVPLTQMRRAIADHMVRSKQIAPHVTTIHEADMTRVIEHMKTHQDEFAKHGAKLTYTPYFIQAAVAALKAVPMVNAQYSDQGIVMKRAMNIGIAVAIEDGLIVPVLKNADDKSLLGLARAVHDLATRARDKKLMPDDVAGGTFTITNYGIFGSLFGTPVINQPQSAILGIGAIQKRVVVTADDAIAIRPMVYLGLTFDHRLLDGAIGDKFMNALKLFLESYQGM
jgi:2-oxoglutarate dehydrogenase E2 component (dihydrolipoamide succinyltransferase)